MSAERPPLEEMTLRQLRRVASEYNVSRYSRMRKDQLLEAIKEAQRIRFSSTVPPRILEAQAEVEAAKFDVGQTDLTVVSLAVVDEALPDLPVGYGDSRIVLMPRDPQWAYAYWDIPNSHKEELRQQGGIRLALRFYDVTDINLDYQRPHSLQQYECDELAREWYLPVPVSDREYAVEIGYIAMDGRWLLLARSASVRIPPVYPSDWVDDQFLTIGWDEALQGKTFLKLEHPSRKYEQVMAPVPEKVFAMAQAAEAQRVAGSVFGSAQQVPEEALSSYVFPSGVGKWAEKTESGVGMSGVGMAARTESGVGMSGVGMSGVGMSGVGMSGVGMSVPTESGVGMSGIGMAARTESGVGMSGVGMYSTSGIGMSGAGMAGRTESGVGMSGVGLYTTSGAGMSGIGMMGLASRTESGIGMSGVGMSGVGMSGVGMYTTSGIGMSGVGMMGLEARTESGIGMSGVGMYTTSGMGMSGVGMYTTSGMGMSGVGFSASMPPIRPRQFWLIADAELIVYGATEPDATVTIGGRPIKLNPDGTFRFQMSFQDGLIDYPIMAVAADGEQTRSLHMKFTRETPERNTNTKEEAVPEWLMEA
jgi:uncharacterized protein